MRHVFGDPCQRRISMWCVSQRPIPRQTRQDPTVGLARRSWRGRLRKVSMVRGSTRSRTDLAGAGMKKRLLTAAVEARIEDMESVSASDLAECRIDVLRKLYRQYVGGSTRAPDGMTRDALTQAILASFLALDASENVPQ